MTRFLAFLAVVFCYGVTGTVATLLLLNFRAVSEPDRDGTSGFQEAGWGVLSPELEAIAERGRIAAGLA
jgi:hypothetical protein